MLWVSRVGTTVFVRLCVLCHHYSAQCQLCCERSGGVAAAQEIVGLDKRNRQVTANWRRLAYKPVVHLDEVGLTSDMYMPLNTTLTSLNALRLLAVCAMHRTCTALHQLDDACAVSESARALPLLAFAVSYLPLHLTIEPMSLARWQLMANLAGSLQAQKDFANACYWLFDYVKHADVASIATAVLRQVFGFGDKDIDDIRRLHNVDVHVTALLYCADLLTLARCLIYCELLCKQITSCMIDCYDAAVLMLCTCTAIHNAAVVVILPLHNGAAVSVSIHGLRHYMAWKLRRATGLTIRRTANGLYWFATPRLTQERATTSSKSSSQQHDRQAIVYLSLLLLPAVLGFSLRSLVMERQALLLRYLAMQPLRLYTGWYSWAIRSLTACVYALGFVLMTPQLYINYKLKSVAHLPWRFLCYRFTNTFIDDLFAFVIKMPTMHRISCFRDDIVFIAYLYQRWIYPTDLNRAMAVEDGGCDETADNVTADAVTDTVAGSGSGTTAAAAAAAAEQCAAATTALHKDAAAVHRSSVVTNGSSGSNSSVSHSAAELRHRSSKKPQQ
eukprot:6661-Heterococcus_DN1.PRE.1